ncbi:MAG TPA: alpha/beta hydrolase [Streptosporangiaceae bacterium]
MKTTSAAGTGQATPIPPWPGELVTVGADELFVRRVPAAPGAEPALCVHGLGGASTNWTDLMDVLRTPAGGVAGGGVAGGLACEAVDLPGFGRSPQSHSGSYSISAQAAVVGRLIEQSGRGPVHLIGNSMGGAIITRLAARRPELVRTLTLISPALPDLRPRPVPARVTVVTVPALGPWLLRRAGKTPAEKRVALLLRDVYYDPSVVHPSRVAEEIAELQRIEGLGYLGDALLKSAQALVAEYLRRGPGSLWRDAASIDASVLVIYGSHDRLVNSKMAVRAARSFRDARVVLLPRTGHVAMLERPGQVAREMWAMMSDAAARGPQA